MLELLGWHRERTTGISAFLLKLPTAPAAAFSMLNFFAPSSTGETSVTTTTEGATSYRMLPLRVVTSQVTSTQNALALLTVNDFILSCRLNALAKHPNKSPVTLRH